MRDYCPHCQYPLRTCVCHAIEIFQAPVQLVILQHPNETLHAKNTARLIRLCLPDTLIVAGKTVADFDNIRQLCQSRNAAVIYPAETSFSLEQELEVFKQNTPDILILLDGSWRQAFGLWHANPWLQALPQWRFSEAPDSRYGIRHTKLDFSLSTLEAAAYVLALGYRVNSDNLLQLQDAMQQHWQGPSEHRRNHCAN